MGPWRSVLLDFFSCHLVGVTALFSWVRSTVFGCADTVVIEW
jgi:hypothetical protein